MCSAPRGHLRANVLQHDVDRHRLEAALDRPARSGSAGTDACSRAWRRCCRRRAACRRASAAPRIAAAAAASAVRLNELNGSTAPDWAVGSCGSWALTSLTNSQLRLGSRARATPRCSQPGAIERRVQPVRRQPRLRIDRPHALDAAAPPAVSPCASAGRTRPATPRESCSSLSGSRDVSTQSTSTPAWRSHAAGDSQAERLAAEVVGRNQKSPHGFIVPRYPCTARATQTTVGGTPPDDRILRTPARPVDAVLHRDVGALQLLRDARVPHPLHDRARGRGRRWASPMPTPHRSTAPTPAAAWGAAILGGIIADRWLGQYRSVLLGGIIITLGHFTLAFPAAALLLHRPRAHRHRHRPAEAERQHAGRLALRRRATPAATPASRSSTWGSTSARLLGPLVAGYLAQRVDWHIGFASAGVGMTLGLVQLRARQAAAPGRRSIGWRRQPTPRSAARPATDAARPAALLGVLGATSGSASPPSSCSSSFGHPVLGRLRAGRLDAEPVRRSLHAARRLRLLVPLVVVPVGAADLRHHAGADLRVDCG